MTHTKCELHIGIKDNNKFLFFSVYFPLSPQRDMFQLTIVGSQPTKHSPKIRCGCRSSRGQNLRFEFVLLRTKGSLSGERYQSIKKVAVLWTAIHLPRWLNGKDPTCRCRRRGFNPWVRKIPWRRKWQPTPGFLPGESHGQRSLAGYSSWGHKSQDSTEHKLPSSIIFFKIRNAKLIEIPGNMGKLTVMFKIFLLEIKEQTKNRAKFE